MNRKEIEIMLLQPTAMRLIFRAVFACLALIAATLQSGAALADFLICNQSSAPEVKAAFGYYEEPNGWTSVGWLVIPKGSCKAAGVGELKNPSYYFYAVKDDMEWAAVGGQQEALFCIDPNKPFTLHTIEHVRTADNVIDCAAHGYVQKNFRQIDVGNNPNYTYNLQAPGTECDLLAAENWDPDRPPSAPGVVFEKIDAQRAIPACRAALETYPDDLRLTYTLGRALAAGKQYDEAVRLYRKAADAGNAHAMSNLGVMYATGQGVGKDEAEAVRLYRKAADAGNAVAMVNLGYAYARGQGVGKDDAEAVRLYRKAADTEDPYAMTIVGSLYETGQGVGKDEAEAVRLYRKAADAGSAEAMTNLGIMYANGRGVGKDEAEAVRLYRKAADAGDAQAMSNLGIMYATGRGVRIDKSEAKQWLRKAADMGNEHAKEALEALRKKKR